MMNPAGTCSALCDLVIEVVLGNEPNVTIFFSFLKAVTKH